MNKPRRQFEIDIHISGDTWDDVVNEIHDTLDHVDVHGPECSSVSGGVHSGHTVTVITTPGKTSEQYHEELQQYLAQRDAATPGAQTILMYQQPAVEGESP